MTAEGKRVRIHPGRGRIDRIIDSLGHHYPEVGYYVAPAAAKLVRYIVSRMTPERQAAFRVFDLASLEPTTLP